MKKHLTLLCSLLVASLSLMVYSCKKSASDLVANKTISGKADTNAVSFSVAAGIAQKAGKSSMISGLAPVTSNDPAGRNLAAGSTAFNKQILDSIAVPDNINPSYFIFNYVNGGYAIIASDLRVEPVLAYSATGYFPHSGTLNSGLLNWLSTNHKNMQLVKSHPELAVPTGVKNLWNELLPEGGITRYRAQIKRALGLVKGPIADMAAPPPPVCQPTSSTITVGPLVKTTWAQGYPYDLLCPTGTYSLNFYSGAPGHEPTGCVATAMAQIMYYWKYPSTAFNWSIMPLTSNTTSSSASNNAVAQLMLNIGLPTNRGGVGMSYADGGSEADASNCTSVFKNTYHYSSAAYGSFNYNTVMNNLNAGEPVMLSGWTDKSSSWIFWTNYTGGHTWVCDGYDEITSTWCASQGQPAGGETYLLFDMNWGWNEVGQPNVNGWYDFNLWEVYNNGPGGVLENFQYSQEMNYNIHP